MADAESRVTRLEKDLAAVTGERDEALVKFLQAMHAADEDIERVWIHRRLAQVHDARGEFVQSAGHAAAAVAFDPTLAWRPLLEPRSQPDTPAWPAAAESLHRLQQSRAAVRDQTLRRTIDDLINIVQATEQRARRAYTGPEIDSKATISGWWLPKSN